MDKTITTADKADFNQAKEHFKQGELSHASKICRALIRNDKSNAQAINLLGVICHRLGHQLRARRLLAIATRLSPDNPILFNNRGTVLKDQHFYEEALLNYKAAIRLNPEFIEAYCNLANTYKDMRKLDEAFSTFEKAMSIDKNNPTANFGIGNTLALMGKYQEAMDYFKKLLKAHAKNPLLHTSIGVCQQNLGHLDKAISHYKKALEVDPRSSEAYSNLGVAYKAQNKLEQAISCYHRALALNTQAYSVYCNLGNVYQKLDNTEAAMKCYTKALAINPYFAEAHNSFGYTLQCMNKIDEAIQHYSMAIKLKENFVDAHWNHALALLAIGDYAKGWEKYEWRWQKKELAEIKKNFTMPKWNGKPLRKKTLLIFTEQGFGDTIQFLRYIPLIKKNQGTIIIETRPELVSLTKSIEGVDKVVRRGATLPKADVYIPLMSLALIFNTTLKTIPNSIPYVFAKPGPLKAIQPHINSKKLKIGFTWGGSLTHKNDRNRSCDINDFIQLAKNPNIQLYSLLVGERQKELEQAEDKEKIIDLSPHLKNFSFTAAAIDNMDLIISVDTVIVHLAGAMNKPTWNLISFCPDWRWGLESTSSPWYPAIKLFRQSAKGSWSHTFVEVEKALAQYVDEENDQ